MVRKSESHRTEDVLMLFKYTENPPENAIFPPAALRVSAMASAYTENSSFRYTLARALPPRLIRNFPTPAQGGSALLHLSRRPLRNVAQKHDGDWT